MLTGSLCENRKCHREWEVQLDVVGIGKCHYCASCAAYLCWKGNKVREKAERDAVVREERRR